jgi:hypothetical protein
MKNNLGRDYFLLAHVDHDRVLFNKPADLGIEFKNEIDAWSMMTFKFRGSRWTDLRYARNDLKSFIYSIRSRID